MKASIFKVLFQSVIVVSAIVMATTVVSVVTSNAGTVPDDNVCTEAGLYCNAEALCKAYIYHMECDSADPKASATACAKTLENYLEVSDKPMPSSTPSPEPLCPELAYSALYDHVTLLKQVANVQFAPWCNYTSFINTESSFDVHLSCGSSSAGTDIELDFEIIDDAGQYYVTVGHYCAEAFDPAYTPYGQNGETCQYSVESDEYNELSVIFIQTILYEAEQVGAVPPQ
jgi:hypothetical protein